MFFFFLHYIIEIRSKNVKIQKYQEKQWQEKKKWQKINVLLYISVAPAAEKLNFYCIFEIGSKNKILGKTNVM